MAAELDDADLAQSFRALLDPIAVVGRDERIVWAAPSTDLLYGAPTAGLTVGELWAPRARSVADVPLHQHLLEVMPELGGRGAVVPLRRADGVEIEVEVLASRTASASGEPLVVLVLRRVAATREPTAGSPLSPARAEDPVHTVVFEASPIGILHFDERGVITACNEAFARIVGMSRRLVIGMDLGTLPDAAITSAVRATLSGRPAYYEGDYDAFTSGKITPLRADFAPVRGEGARVVGGVGLVQDVTERRDAERALRRSESNLRLITESAPDGIGVVSGARFAYANPALARLLGSEPEALVGRAPAELAVDPATFEAMLGELGSTREAQQEQRLRSATGRVVVAEISGLAIPYEGRPALLLHFRDVTERAEHRALLSHADRMASIGTLAAGVAHEVNNPLAYVSGSLGLVKSAAAELERLAGDGEQVRALTQRLDDAWRNASEGVERVRVIVKDLMTFSRPSAESRTAVDVALVIDSAVGLAWNEIRHRAVLRREFVDVPAVIADEARLGQVVLNLLMNAVQAMPEERGKKGEIVVGTYLAGDQVAFFVEDDGPGISEAELSRVFEPFYTTKPRGTGLGLSVCHGIVRAFGGQISATRRAPHGTRFVVQLPAASVEVDRSSSVPPSSKSASGVRARILVIDDEPRLGRTLRVALEGRHDVVVAESGREALDRLAHDRAFDLVLCDVMMPDVSGTVVYQEICTHAPELIKRFAFMTGGAFTDPTRRFLDGYTGRTLDKPFSVDDIEALIAHLATR